MGETHSTPIRLDFNRALRIEGRPENLTSNAGVLALREVDERLGFTRSLCHRLRDPRAGHRVEHSLEELVRTRLLMLASGYDGQRDVAHVLNDPAFLASVSSKRGGGFLGRTLPSQPTLGRLQRTLGEADNLEHLEAGVFDLARRSIAALGGPGSRELTIDVDSTPIDSHGHQPGSVYNGHYRRRCFHPIVATLAETDHILGGKLRPGNEATNKGVGDFLLPLIDRTREEIGPVGWVRGDAGFTSNELLSALENRRLKYVFRMRRNCRLDALAAPYLEAPKGPKPDELREWLVDLDYQSDLWRRKRRVILVIQERPDSLFLHYYFLVTNCRRRSPEWLLQHYRDRGAMEGRLGDFKGAFHPALSCTTQGAGQERRAHAYAANASTFQLYLMADGLLHTLRELAGHRTSSDAISLPSLHRVRRVLVQVAARMTRSGRRITVIVGEATHALWSHVFRRLDRLLPAT